MLPSKYSINILSNNESNTSVVGPEPTGNHRSRLLRTAQPTKTMTEKTVTSRNKVINDPIYGMIYLNQKLFRIIDTAIYQRLRDIKQLGGLYMVFPGASHNRFEHCIGTAHLTGVWLTKLRKNLGKDKSLFSKQDILHAQIAALCHDLGHGPFSHMFQDVFIKEAQGALKNWTHEDASCHLLRLIVKECEASQDTQVIQDLQDLLGPVSMRGDVLDKITCMIKGTKWSKDANRPFLYQIVANKLNGIDADKLDYLARDTHSAALNLGFSVDRLIDFSAIKNVEPHGLIVCFHRKISNNVFNLFKSRYNLHKDVYSHTVVEGIELMIADVFKAAKSTKRFNLGKMLEFNEQSLQNYALITDCILKEIERANVDDEIYSEPDGAKKLEEAKRLVWKIRHRQLYTSVVEISVNLDVIRNESNVKPKDIVRGQAQDLKRSLAHYMMRTSQEDIFDQPKKKLKVADGNEPVTPEIPATPPTAVSDEMFRVTTRVFDMAEFNPKSIHFYDQMDQKDGTTMPHLFSSHFQPEAFIRVYTSKKDKLETVKDAVQHVIEGKKGLNMYVLPKARRSREEVNASTSTIDL